MSSEQDDDLGRDSTKIVELDQQSIGRLSRMDALQQQAMAKAVQIRRQQGEARIYAALDRIKATEYGYCLDCGDDISEARLSLDPTTPLCITCASGR